MSYLLQGGRFIRVGGGRTTTLLGGFFHTGYNRLRLCVCVCGGGGGGGGGGEKVNHTRYGTVASITSLKLHLHM